jgi:UDP-N-acetylmuramate dehydrogenase
MATQIIAHEFKTLGLVTSKRNLTKGPVLRTKTCVPLAPLTTFRLGGPARILARVRSVAELEEAFELGRQESLATLVLGGGSNVLFADAGFDGLVVKVDLRGMEFVDSGDGVTLRAGAGETWDNLVKEAVKRKLGGLENLSLIPGSVGGALYQNIGAYGAELKDVLESAKAFDVRTRQARTMTNAECGFGYRESVFQHEPQLVVLSARLRLSRGARPQLAYPDLERRFRGKPEPSLWQVRRAVIQIRKGKFPYAERLGNAGSFFKNPVLRAEQFEDLLEHCPDLKSFPWGTGCVKVPAAQLIEKAGWKGKRYGNVGVSERHSLVLVHYGHGKSSELLDLARRIVEDVEKNFGITLEPEVRIVGSRL